ncbi:MAG: hypothetical protein WDO73_11635 [Ignavibacteriota bacterium]
MRYWAYLAGKVVVAAAPLYGLLVLLERSFPGAPQGAWPRLHNMSNELAGLPLDARLVSTLHRALYVIVWDQRRRCRVCLTRLRMPIETGSRSYMLQLGRPTVESICPYGHGTLSQDELQITGRDTPRVEA